MSFFVVKYCDIKACLYWRIGNNCVKNGSQINAHIKYMAYIHDSNLCEIRRQIDKYRLEQLLENNDAN